MKSIISFYLFAFVLVSLFSSCGLISKRAVSNENQSLPEMMLISPDGRNVQLSSFKGKKVFVNLWATWCPPCVAEMPSIQKLYNQTDRKQSEFVLISFDKNFETAKDWAQRKRLNMPVYSVSGDLPELFNVNGIPTTFIFDESGKLIFKQTGSDDYNTNRFVQLLSSMP
ncbi:MAG: TlpA family protein disulfide reductase [Chitinophagaceae bacterium]|nr:TlpA family protein disulfide reductase [Chitinophagaceae bacterium]